MSIKKLKKDLENRKIEIEQLVKIINDQLSRKKVWELSQITIPESGGRIHYSIDYTEWDQD
ncbi:hypothetical protein COB64_01965 [Candidatus Wolfebacteria bacterium]|nr:MAG: hypothetical protein COB64_01965 [Candidatus Wolfebacteria bacterium]